MPTKAKKPLHTLRDRNAPVLKKDQGKITVQYTQQFIDLQRTLSYRMVSHFHPFVAQLMKKLIETPTDPVTALQECDTDESAGAATDVEGRDRPAAFYQTIFSDTNYAPKSPAVDTAHPPVKELEFDSDQPYSVYNWELFYHAPLQIGLLLSKAGRYEDAQKWFHYIFDPTDDSSGPTPERFWKVWPLQHTDVATIEAILTNLSAGTDPVLLQKTLASITAWRNQPFSPHVVARYRVTPYMFRALFAYLDNLIAWGDSLFQEDTGESINEATQLYILAANILGDKPEEVPQKGTVGVLTYAQLRGSSGTNQLDAFSNALVHLETEIPFELGPTPDDAQPVDLLSALRSLGKVLYFCVPRNDKLLGYWDTVADRLFKIHNSLNLQGVFRQLPLFEPPIDPALLARAAAAGLDVGAVAAGLNQPLPLVRCMHLIQKATELCQEVESLGGQFLATLEKGDNEVLALMRAQHERNLLQIAEAVKYAQLQEAQKAREGVERTLATTTARYLYYEGLLGDSTVTIPTLDAVDNDALMNFNFSSFEPVLGPRNIDIDIDPQGSTQADGNQLSHYETSELSKLSDSQDSQVSVTTAESLASIMNIIPTFGTKFEPLGVGGSLSFGGSNIAAIFQAGAAVARGESTKSTYEANRSAKIGSYNRRSLEWTFQSNTAANEISQLFKQLRSAQIREAIAQREWDNHKVQIQQAEDIEQFISNKTTNQAFYLWMKGEVNGLYSRCFQLAFETAKKAERALQHELGDDTLSFIQYDYLSGKQGLLAGEKLHFDVKRMEMAYLDLNQREYELTRHVSLLELDPHALLQLRATGACAVTLPEESFDLDGPGHYFRRLKAVAVSLPCVAGPYVSVPCTLTLLSSSIRKTSLLNGDYSRGPSNDNNFDDHFGSLQSIVTSSAQNDSGLFETNLNDERFLPFERSGAISKWTLQLPQTIQQFDYQTISDVVFHLRYTAREGGAALNQAASGHFNDLIAAGTAPGSLSLLSIRQEFPEAWAAFQNAPAGPRYPLTLNLAPEHYPFFARQRLKSLSEVELFAGGATKDITMTGQSDGSGPKGILTQAPPYGDLRWGAIAGPKGLLTPPAPTGSFTIYLDNNSIDDLWIILTWLG